VQDNINPEIENVIMLQPVISYRGLIALMFLQHFVVCFN